MDEALEELAAAHGVATEYRGDGRRLVTVDEEVVVGVLGLVGVDATTTESREAALALARERAATGALPGTVAHRPDRTRPLPEPGEPRGVRR